MEAERLVEGTIVDKYGEEAENIEHVELSSSSIAFP